MQMLRLSLFVIANRTDEFSAFATGLDRLEALVNAIQGTDTPDARGSAVFERVYTFDADGRALLGGVGGDAAGDHELTDIIGGGGAGARGKGEESGLELVDLSVGIPLAATSAGCARTLVRGLNFRLAHGMLPVQRGGGAFTRA